MRWHIFDTETTGLPGPSILPLEKQPHIIEYYGCIFDDEKGEVTSELEFLANPGIKLEPIITKITGLTDADLANEPPFSDFVPAVMEQIASASGTVAHNWSFDRQMVELEMKRADQELIWPERRVCTVEATTHLRGHRLNLTKLHTALFNEPFADAHRARHDVTALVRCFRELLERGIVQCQPETAKPPAENPAESGDQKASVTPDQEPKSEPKSKGKQPAPAATNPNPSEENDHV